MKRNSFSRTVAILSLTLILILSGCSESKQMKKYTAYAVGEFGGIEGGESVNRSEPSAIRTYEDNTYEIPEPKEKTITLSILGKQFTAEYDSSEHKRFGGANYVYMTPDKDIITVDSSSGTVVNIHFSRRYTYYVDEYNWTEERTEKSRPRAIENAERAFRDIYGDNPDYTYTPVVNDNITSNTIWVWIEEDHEADPDLPYKFPQIRALFTMTKDGEPLNMFSTGLIGKLKGKSVPKDFTLDTVREIVGKMAADKKTKIEPEFDFDNWDRKQFYVILLPDGRLACQTYVYVNGDAENKVEVIIPLE